MQSDQNVSTADSPPFSDVIHVHAGGRDVILVGTAHVSRESADLVREVLEKEKPDRVCVELDSQRFEALSQPQRWESLDLKTVIRHKQLSTLMVNLILSSYQKRMGDQLGILPGMEMLEAIRVAEAQGIPIALCDRDVRVTLRRAWRSTPWYKKSFLLSSLMVSVFAKTEISEDMLRDIRRQDILSELMQELGEVAPTLKRVLIDERDTYLAQKIRETPGERIVAVVGAGHVEGIRQALLSNRSADLNAINTIPPPSPVWKWVGWSIPAVILGSIGLIAWLHGLDVAKDNLVYWILANGIPSGIGAILAWAHPGTIITAFFAAPVTSLTPVIGAGYVTAFVQAYLQPPVVREFHTVSDDIGFPAKWWQNRILRIFLAFLFPTIGSIIGTWIGGYGIISTLF